MAGGARLSAPSPSAPSSAARSQGRITAGGGYYPSYSSYPAYGYSYPSYGYSYAPAYYGYAYAPRPYYSCWRYGYRVC